MRNTDFHCKYGIQLNSYNKNKSGRKTMCIHTKRPNNFTILWEVLKKSTEDLLTLHAFLSET